MAKKEERFTMEQRRNLALLHEEIDHYIKEFTQRYLSRVAHNFSTKGKIEDPKKKSRLVFILNKEEMREEQKTCDTFLHRMFYITKNVPVRSITNKLLNIFPNGRRLTVASMLSYKTYEVTIDHVLSKMEALQQKQMLNEEEHERLNALEEIYQHMKSSHRETIQRKTFSEKVIYSVYNQKDEPLKEKGFFQGGVVVPPECEIRPPIKRKAPKRKNKTETISVGENVYIINKGNLHVE